MSFKSYGVFAALSLTSVACTPVQMEIEPDLQVHGKEHLLTEKPSLFNSKPYVIGDFRTDKLEVSWAKGSGGTLKIGAFGKTSTDKQQTFTFDLLDGKNAGKMSVDCTMTRHQEGMKIAGLGTTDETQSFNCDFTSERGAAWSLAFNGRDGTLKRATTAYLMLPESHASDGHNQMTTLGFSFRHKDEVEAEAMTAATAGFWLREGLNEDTRLALAAASTAMIVLNQKDSTRSLPSE